MGKLLHTVVPVDEAARTALLALLPAKLQAVYARALQAALKPLGVGAGHNNSTGGPDLGPLVRAGVPIAGPQQDGTDYFDYHHTPDDTFDKIVPAQFRQNVAVYAAFTWIAAESGWDFRN